MSDQKDLSGRDAGQDVLRLTITGVGGAGTDAPFCRGLIATGSLARGDEIIVLPSAVRSRILRVQVGRHVRDHATMGDEVILELDRIDGIKSGEIGCHLHARAEVAGQFAVDLVWSGEKDLVKGRPYNLNCAGQATTVQITDVRNRLDVVTGERLEARGLKQGETGQCKISLETPIAYDAHNKNSQMGSFVLTDRASGELVASGSIVYALRRSQNIHWQALTISREQRALLKGQRACCLWLTGLSGAGKSTIADLLEKRLFDLRFHSYILDGDNVRHGLNKDLGFTETDRVENIRRVAEVARLMYDAGLITIVSFISPFRAERRFARERFPPGDFLEIYIDTPLTVCEQRDPKGLYKKARSGQLANFTGINSPYEAPEHPEIVIEQGGSPEEAVDLIMSELARWAFLEGY